MIWNFLDTGARSGDANMLIDEALALRLQAGIGSPTLRVYRWQPFAVSLGFNEPANDFDPLRLRNAGIDLVRRPTGGRAILHAEELTYSVVMRIDGQSLKAIYGLINSALLAGVRLLGIDAALAASSDDFRALYAGPSSIPCFAASAKSEIQYRGKKLIGSAQRRYGEVILQHGSFLLGPGHRRIAEFLSPQAATIQRTIEQHLETHTIDARAILGREVTFEETAQCIRHGFESVCGVGFTPSSFVGPEAVGAMLPTQSMDIAS